MERASHLFSEADRERIAQAVRIAESKTSAEIVPVVASSSGRYDRGEDICGLWVGIAAMIGVWTLFPRQVEDPGAWDASGSWIEVAGLAAAVVAGFIFGAFVATRWSALQRLFTPRSEMRLEVDRRARSVFFDTRVHHTTGSTGILIYVSLLEHMTAVISDQAVVTAIGQRALDELCSQLSEKLTAGGATDALCATIASAGDKLGAALPRASGDVNELADALITLDALA